MDGAWLGSIDISIRKARTARFFDMNTETSALHHSRAARCTTSKSPTVV